MLRLVGEQLARREMFTIDWHFHQATGLSSASFDEMADPQPFSEAYPTLGESVADFVARYLASREAVLILQGPPGTGKTRLVRAILAALSARKGDSAGCSTLPISERSTMMRFSSNSLPAVTMLS